MEISTRKDNTCCNVDERILYLGDDIDESSTGILIFNILYFNSKDAKSFQEKKNFTPEPIRLYINSYGGGIHDCWALVDAIISSDTPVYTYCTGYAFSAAFKIFLAGERRFCTRHTTFMYHQMNCTRTGKFQDLVEDRDEMDYMQNTIEQYVLERTHFTAKQLKDIRNKKKDVYIHPEEALKLGIVHEIL